MRGDAEGVGLCSGMYSLYLELMKSRNALVLTNSEHTRQVLHQYAGIPLNRIVAVMAGLNQPANAALPKPSDVAVVLAKHRLERPFFMSVGAFDSHKDPLTMLKGFFEAQGSIPALRLAVVGSMLDPYKLEYKKKIEQLGG